MTGEMADQPDQSFWASMHIAVERACVSDWIKAHLDKLNGRFILFSVKFKSADPLFGRSALSFAVQDHQDFYGCRWVSCLGHLK